MNHICFSKEEHLPDWARPDNKVTKGDRVEKRTFPVLSRNGTHCNYMVIYDCCSCCGQHCTHLTAHPVPHVQRLWQLYFSQSSTENGRLGLQIRWLSMSPYANGECGAAACFVATDIYRAGILSHTILNTELKVVFRRVRNTAKSDW